MGTWIADLTALFSECTGQRSERGKRHRLFNIIEMAIVGVIADDRVSIDRAGQAKEKWWRAFLEIPHGIPSQATLDKVFTWFDPQEF